MEKAPKNMLKEYVKSQHFESTTEVMTAMKEMFADVLQQVMSCELDAHLGNEKSERASDSAVETWEKNYRNGYSKKTVKIPKPFILTQILPWEIPFYTKFSALLKHHLSCNCGHHCFVELLYDMVTSKAETRPTAQTDVNK